VLLIFAGLLGLSGQARDSWAAAEVHRLNLALSGIPTQVGAKDFNERLGDFNRQYLDPQGWEGLKKITFAWLFDAQLRYFVRPNVVVEAGVGQLRQQSKREFLPALQADIQLRAEMLSVPVHVGGAYYLQPYNQGDFRAQAYLGGGFTSLVYNRARIHSVFTFADTTFSTQITGRGDAPGFYVEGGAHMFFAARYSVMLGLIYRNAIVRDMQWIAPNGQRFRLADLPPQVPLGGLRNFDVGGVGVKMALVIGL
jgi:hypothetical protein